MYIPRVVLKAPRAKMKYREIVKGKPLVYIRAMWQVSAFFILLFIIFFFAVDRLAYTPKEFEIKRYA